MTHAGNKGLIICATDAPKLSAIVGQAIAKNKELLLSDDFGRGERGKVSGERGAGFFHREGGGGEPNREGAKGARWRDGIAPVHEHTGYEHIIVLAGTQRDQIGTATAGRLIINPPRTRHGVVSEAGSIVLAIYEKPVKFLQD